MSRSLESDSDPNSTIYGSGGYSAMAACWNHTQGALKIFHPRDSKLIVLQCSLGTVIWGSKV